MNTGWDESAAACIAVIGEDGDFSRKHVLDKPMLERVRAGGFKSALDVGCGEGRFSRMLRAAGIQTVGIDPTEILIEEARRRDPEGDYRLAAAEELPFADRSLDLVVSYPSLIDIPDAPKAISEMPPGTRRQTAHCQSDEFRHCRRRLVGPTGTEVLHRQIFGDSGTPVGMERHPDHQLAPAAQLLHATPAVRGPHPPALRRTATIRR
jgi:2-polyprenyl-3-methyl-5-hydroxy-6-metoxy-1,4-benzoquinol methylase